MKLMCKYSIVIEIEKITIETRIICTKKVPDLIQLTIVHNIVEKNMHSNVQNNMQFRD